MITIYGIKNCDVMQKAFKWLDANKVKYTFHDYRVDGIDAATIGHWLKHLPADKLVNLRSTTYRELPENEKPAVLNKKNATELMMKYTSLIKRPVWDFGNDVLLLGWNETELEKLVK